MTPSQIMQRAAQLLREDARAGYESCAIGEQGWACSDCPAKRGERCSEREAHDARLKIAASLEAMAA